MGSGRSDMYEAPWLVPPSAPKHMSSWRQGTSTPKRGDDTPAPPNAVRYIARRGLLPCPAPHCRTLAHSAIGSHANHRMRNRAVCRVYDSGIGLRRICVHAAQRQA